MGSDVFIPTEKDEQNTRVPLYRAIGLSEAQSNKVFFAITEDIIPVKKTTAECLKAIQDRPGWTEMEKIWAAYHLKIEMLVKAGVPRALISKLDVIG